jgi:hypothetical protein
MKTESGAVVDTARVILTGDAAGSTAAATSEAQAGTLSITLNTVGTGKGGTGNTATPTNGQLLIGNGTGFTLATLTQGSGVTITNAGGSITIAASGSAAPAGQIIQFAGTSAPTGYLICPIAATNVSRTTYAALFAAIGTTWGVGDGSTTFGLPYFAADNAILQANSNVGQYTGGQVIAHTHYTSIPVIGGCGATVNGTITGFNIGSDSIQSGTTGGIGNLAAGRRVLICVKY